MNMPRELLKGIYEIEIIAKRQSEELFPGIHESAFLGDGYNPVIHKEYEPGDNVRNIDWHAFARSPDKIDVIQFREYKYMTIWILADVSGSVRFGFDNLSKRELLVKAAAFIGISAAITLDNVGLVAFSNKLNKRLIPKNSKDWVYYLLDQIWKFSKRTTKTSIGPCLKKSRRYFKEHSMVFLISDFLDPDCSKKNSFFWEQAKKIAERHDLIPVVLDENPNFLLNTKGNVRLRDIESGKNVKVKLSANSRKKFEKELEQRRSFIKNSFMEFGVRPIFIRQESDLRKPMKFFLIRKRGKLK